MMSATNYSKTSFFDADRKKCCEQIRLTPQQCYQCWLLDYDPSNYFIMDINILYLDQAHDQILPKGFISSLEKLLIK